ncbi:MAG: MotA/TolQ/ExbB proton channel family protein [Verrucomicrobiales bacterium]
MSLLRDILTEIQVLSSEGGWVFWALLGLAFGIAYALLSLWRAMRFPEAPLLSSNEWARLLDPRQEPRQLVENLRVRLNDSTDPSGRLREVGQKLFDVPRRRFPFAFVLIGAAPLIGLLGTVSGMFTTFRGMATATATSPIDVISKGISEALITTQTGLVIGVPTFIVCSWLKSRFEQQVLAFQQVESQLLQPTAT